MESIVRYIHLKEIRVRRSLRRRMFGMRGSKLVGAQLFPFLSAVPLLVGSVSVGLVAVWVFMARIVGRSNERAVRDGKVIS